MIPEDYSLYFCLECKSRADRLYGGLCGKCEITRLDEIATPREDRCALCIQSIHPCPICAVRQAFRSPKPPILRAYDDWKEEQVTAELRDQFFLHEMKIASCDFTNDRIVVYPIYLAEEVSK